MTLESNNKRIAKNTILLYIRTAIVLVVSLYTSRMILKALGADDLGIYNVVGGIVLLMSFFRTTLSKSTSRFLTYELGNNSDKTALNKVFSSSMTIHLIISFAAIILGETIGLFILNYWTDIPELRQNAAFWIFQCSLAIFTLQIIVIPYESVLIAQENMSVYAYLTILSSLLKLGVVLLLYVIKIDRLILYGGLLVLVDLLLLILYILYDKRKYDYLNFKLLWDANYSKSIFMFSGWTLLGSSANVATQQGVSLLFNNFVGLVANTALGFANQVNAAVQSFVGSFQTAFNPQIIKLYAQSEYSQMHLLMTRASKFSFILAYVFSLPLIANMDYILQIWLGDVPAYTVEFCILILVCCIIDSVSGVFNTAITATGEIKGFQIWISISFFGDLLTATLLLIFKFEPALVFGSRIITRGVVNMIIELYYVRIQINYCIKQYLIKVLIPIVLTVVSTIPITIIVCRYFSNWQRLLFTTIATLFVSIVLVLTLYLSKEERKVLIASIVTKHRKVW